MEAFRPVEGTRCRLRWQTSSEIAHRSERRNAPGNEHSRRLRRRSATGSGRSADGRRREAVRRDLPEVQGSRVSKGLPVLTGEIDKTAARGIALIGRQAGEAGEAAGECGGGSVMIEPTGEGLAAAEAQPRSEGAELSDPSLKSAGGGRQGHRQAFGRRDGYHDSTGVASELGRVQREGVFAGRSQGIVAEVAGDVPDGNRPRPSCGSRNGCCGNGA